MERRETLLYAITIISLIAFVYIFFSAISKTPSISDKQSMGLTGNVVFDSSGDYKIGDKLMGNISLKSNEKDAYGVLLLTKDSKPITTETFNIAEIARESGDGTYVVRLEDVINYSFEEKGNYELFFSVLNLNINIRKDFAVQ